MIIKQGMVKIVIQFIIGKKVKKSLMQDGQTPLVYKTLMHKVKNLFMVNFTSLENSRLLLRCLVIIQLTFIVMISMLQS